MLRLVASLAVTAAILAAPAHAGPPGDISTFAGNGADGPGGEGETAAAASFHNPMDLELLADGSVLVADTGNHRVRRIWPSGMVATVAGTGAPGFSGDGGAATSARLSSPTGVAAAGDGGFLIADRGNRRVRKVSAGGLIATVAGTGAAGAFGDGGPATSATLDEPAGLAIAPDGGFLIADAGSNRVRAVSPAGTISTVAGGGAGGDDDDDDDDEEGGTGSSGDGGPATSAVLLSPVGVAAAPGGGFVISEQQAHRVRLVSPAGTITRVAGTGVAGFSGDGGPATSARINQPAGIAPTPDGGLLIADSRNGRIRKVTPEGTIATLAGSGHTGFGGDGGPAALAHLNLPQAVATSLGGALLIADAGNNRLRIVEGAPVAASDPGPAASGGGGAGGSPMTGGGGTGPGTTAKAALRLNRWRLGLRLPRSIRVGADGTLHLPVGCPSTSPGRCRGTIRLELRPRQRRGTVRAASARSRVVARARFSVAPGHTRRVRLRLSRPARRLLRKRGSLSVRVVAARRGGPNIGSKSKRVTLKLERKRP
jgi:hypothetical protein